MKLKTLKKIAVLPFVIVSLCNCHVHLNASASYGNNLSFADKVVWLVNQERTTNGLPPLYASTALNQAAEIRSQELTELFSHTRPDGRSGFSILDDRAINWRYVGENIAAGHTTPEIVVKNWMNSEGHRANILNPNYQYIGVGYVTGNYWTQLFIGGVIRKDVYLPEESQTLLGDVNQDGEINAEDAALILVQSAELGSGHGNSLDEEAQKASDVNGDSSINASDASAVLLYSASRATSSTTSSLPIFMTGNIHPVNAAVGEACTETK